ncbi:unnamed protein product [Symbiodinium sp. CCMP2592]|nr:unnamed protein product [Symbiodinium sp. CCMP2592]
MSDTEAESSTASGQADLQTVGSSRSVLRLLWQYLPFQAQLALRVVNASGIGGMLATLAPTLPAVEVNETADLGACWAAQETPSDAASSALASVAPSHDFLAQVSTAQPGLVQHAAIDAFHKIGKLSSIQMPWELAPVRTIFDGMEASLEPNLSAHPLTEACTVVSDRTPAKPANPATVCDFVSADLGPVFSSVVKAGTGFSPQEKREHEWSKGVNLWADICVRFKHECEPGIAAATASDSTPARFREEVISNVEACLGVKSPFTVRKRAYSFAAWLRWRDAELPCCTANLTEADAWRYVASLKANRAPPTKADAFLSSVRFAHHVLGFRLSIVVDSKRVRGAAQQMFAGKAALKQARVLSVRQVLALHAGLADSSRHLFDRAMCAYTLVALYGRARHSDLEQISVMTHDHDHQGGFLEILTRKHKGAKSAQKKSRFMPILVPAIGIHGKPWMHLLVEVFEKLKLPVRGEINGPLLRVPVDSECSAFAARAVSSGEVSAFLRAFLSVPPPAAGEREVLEVKDEADKEISPALECPGQPREQNSSSSSSESESEDSGSDSGGEQQAAMQVKRQRGRKPVNREAQVWWVHCKSQVLHLVNGQESELAETRVFACGRSVSMSYRLAEEADLEGHECCTCRKNK